MSSVSTVFNPKEHCPWIAMLSGSGPMGDLGDNALYEIGRDDHGVDVKFYGDTTGVFMQWDQSANELVLYAPTFGENDNILDIDVYPSSVSACSRQGAAVFTMRRDTAMTSWDGNADTCFRVYSYNYGANTTARCRIQGMELLARNRTGSCSKVTGAYVTAENYVGAVGVVDVIGMEVHPKNNAVASGDVIGLRIYDESQSATGTSYGLIVDCTGESSVTHEYCIYINTSTTTNGTGTWTNGLTFDGQITNALDFADTNGTNGATYSSGHYSSLGNVDGKIKVDIGGNTLYIPCYASIA